MKSPFFAPLLRPDRNCELWFFKVTAVYAAAAKVEEEEQYELISSGPFAEKTPISEAGIR